MSSTRELARDMLALLGKYNLDEDVNHIIIKMGAAALGRINFASGLTSVDDTDSESDTGSNVEEEPPAAEEEPVAPPEPVPEPVVMAYQAMSRDELKKLCITRGVNRDAKSGLLISIGGRVFHNLKATDFIELLEADDAANVTNAA